MKKYGFVGSHGTGKSSAALHLAALLKLNNRDKSVKLLEENVREIANIFNNNLNNSNFQKLCMVDHLHKELTSEQLYDLVVCDRTTLDTLVYGMVYKVKLPPEYFSLALNNLNSFEKIFFVRPKNRDSGLSPDGFRDTNIELRNEVDLQFEKMLHLWGGKFEVVFSDEIFTYNYVK